MVAGRYRVGSPWHNGQFFPTRDQLRIKASFSRPNDTNVYAAGDVISTATSLTDGYASFSTVNLNAGTDLTESAASLASLWTKFKYDGGVIKSARIVGSAYQTTLPALSLWLFSSTVLGSLNDNAALAVTDATIISYHIDTIDFPVPDIGVPTVGASGNIVHKAKDLNVVWPGYGPLGVSTGESAGTAINGVLVVGNAYTPVANEQFDIFLDVELL